MTDLAALNKSVSLTSASHDFVLLAKSLAAAKGGISETQHLARTVPSMRVREVLTDLKAAVNPMSLSDSSALAPYAQLATGFFGSLAAFSAFSKIYNANDFTRVPLRTIIAVLTTAPVAESVSELSARPFASGSFATATLDTQKVSAIIAITNELAKSAAPSALSMLGNELRRAAGIAVECKMDRTFGGDPRNHQRSNHRRDKHNDLGRPDGTAQCVDDWCR
jgi:hypothetical protein